ncbi:hypothetical protein MBLNU230_g7687t1 [Neophaeotheca triangularis]
MASALRSPALRLAFSAPTARSTTTSILPALRSQTARQTALQPSPIAQNAIRVAGFQTSSSRKILPPLPQKIKGSVNEAVKVPEPEYAHGSYHWAMERAVSAALVPLTIAPFAAGSLNPAMDGLLIGLTLLHSHIGFQSCIIDYFPRWRVPNVRRFLMWTLNACFLIVGAGFYEFETNDVGLTEGIKRIWHA